MEPNCCKDDTSKVGSLTSPSPGFQDALFSLTQEDFKLIDTNNSGNLTAQELRTATTRDDLDPSKRAAVNLIGEHVDNSKIDVTVQGAKVQMAATLPSWHTTAFAKNQLSKDDFKLIDSNGDEILDSKELKSALNNPTFDQADKHGISLLDTELDALLNDKLFEIKGGGVKNWHKEERSILKQVADNKATTPSVDLHLTEDQASEQVSVSKVDGRGNPTQIETSGSYSTIKYDANDRITDVETTLAYSKEEPVINKIVYNDKKNTQTIITEAYGSQTTTVNHLGKDGKVKQEDFSTKGRGPDNDDYNNNISTKFNEKGQIVSQTTFTDDGGQTIASAEYDGDKRKSTTSVHFDANGVKTRESQSDFANRLTTIKEYDGERTTRAIEIDRKDPKKPTMKDTSFDKDGNVSEVNEITFGKPYLIDKIVQKDADGNTVSTAVAEWNMFSLSSGRLNAIQITDANGQTRKLDAQSTGEDRKLWKQMESRIYRHSRQSTDTNHVDEESPGSYQLFTPTSAPA